MAINKFAVLWQGPDNPDLQYSCTALHLTNGLSHSSDNNHYSHWIYLLDAHLFWDSIIYHSQAKRIFMMCPYKKYQVQGLEVFDGVNLEYLVQCSSSSSEGFNQAIRPTIESWWLSDVTFHNRPHSVQTLQYHAVQPPIVYLNSL